MSPRPPSERSRVAKAAAALRRLAGGALDGTVVLGSGIAPPALEGGKRHPWRRVPGLPVPAVEGHAPFILTGRAHGGRLAVFAGRSHLYEGATPAEVVRAVRAAAAAGARFLVVTNASGGVATGLRPGTLLVVKDHVDLAGADPAFGEEDGTFGARFCSMAGAYDAGLRRAARERARREGILHAEGAYAFVRGPGFETAAEVRRLRQMGVAAVGMSTVPEVQAARRLGMRVFGLSVVANRAGSPEDGHEEVLGRVRACAAEVAGVLDAVLAAAAEPVP